MNKELSLEDAALFMRQFVTVARGITGIAEGLEILEKEGATTSTRELAGKVRKDVQAGISLGESFRRRAGGLPPAVLNAVITGDRSGKIVEALERSAEYLLDALAMKRRLMQALFYPVILTFLLGVALLIMFKMLLPRFAELYSLMKTDLPFPTRILMSITGWVSSRWLLVLALLILAGVIFHEFSRSAPGRRFISGVALVTPYIGPLVSGLEMTVFFKSLKMQFSGGRNFVEAVHSSADSVNNIILREQLLQCARMLEKGMTVGEAFERASSIPKLIVHLLKSGEKANRLDETLAVIVDYFDKEMKYSIEKFFSWFTPAVIMIEGTVVAAILLASYLPVFTMARAVPV